MTIDEKHFKFNEQLGVKKSLKRNSNYIFVNFSVELHMWSIKYLWNIFWNEIKKLPVWSDCKLYDFKFLICFNSICWVEKNPFKDSDKIQSPTGHQLFNTDLIFLLFIRCLKMEWTPCFYWIGWSIPTYFFSTWDSNLQLTTKKKSWMDWLEVLNGNIVILWLISIPKTV